MIRVCKFEKRGIVSGNLKDLGNSSKCWAECINPTPKELKDISSVAKIPLHDLKEALDKEERPKVSELEHYSLIVIRAPWMDHNAIKTTPITIFISKHKNNVITISLKELHSADNIRELIKTNKINMYKESISFFTYKFLDEIFDTYFSVLDILEEKIDHIEDVVIEKPEKMKVHDIFLVKKALIFFHKALTANREVVASIEKEYIKHIDKKNVKRFRNLYDEATQLIDMEGTYRDILTGTLDIYLSSVSNNMNKVMKTLTVGASFILIPTLISGIYGMNFYFMPEINSSLGIEFGYYFALGLMVFSVVVSYLFFKKKGWM